MSETIFKLASNEMKTLVNWGKGRIPYVAVKAIVDDPQIAENLKKGLMSKNFREFRGLFTKMITPENLDVVRADLDTLASSLGMAVNHTQGLDAIAEFFKKMNIKPRPVPAPVASPAEPIPTEPAGTEVKPPEETPEKKTETPALTAPQLEELRKKFKGAVWIKNPIEKSKNIQEVVAEAMKVLASDTAKALQDSDIAQYLFVKALNKRSWYNQILIMIQKPQANMLKGSVQWLNHGRYVPGYPYKAEDIARLKKMGIEIPWTHPNDSKKDESIIQCLPKNFQTKVSPYDNNAVLQAVVSFVRKNGDKDLPANLDMLTKDMANTLSTYKSLNKYLAYVRQVITDNNIDNTRNLISFLNARSNSTSTMDIRSFEYKPIIYDIGDTLPLPNWEVATGKKPAEPIKREEWIGRNIGDEDKAKVINQALLDFAKTKDIPINFTDTGDAGGIASAEGIVIDRTAPPIIQLGTLVHELTHKFVHFEGEKLNKIKNNILRSDAETDAEAAAYIIKSKLGYETENASVYVALHNSSRFTDLKEMQKHIADRAKIIDKVVGTISEFIDEYFQNTGNERFIEAFKKILQLNKTGANKDKITGWALV